MPKHAVTRRSFLAGGAAAAAGAAAVASTGCAHIWVPRRGLRERPNIVVLFSDDQRWDAMGCAGHPVLRTPNLDAIAARGTYFSNSFVTTSICCVNRANILTGQYARRHGIHDFFRQFTPEQFRGLYPSLLGEAGYQTGFLGKWGIGDSVEATSMAAAIFDYWAGASHQTNFWHDEECRYVVADGWELRANNTCDCPPDSRGVPAMHVRIGRENIARPTHLETDIFPAKIDDFLARRDRNAPFCLSIFYKSPHSPYSDYADEVARLYDGMDMPRPRTATPEHAARRPEFLQRHLGGPTGRRFVEDPEHFAAFSRQYYRLVTGMDLSIGRLREQLRAAGVADNTVFLFTSDNGYFHGEHGYAGKWLMHEPSLRVPFLYMDPRLRDSQRVAQTGEPVLTIDVAPTVLDLAGVPRPASMQGKSVVPIAEGRSRRLRDRFFYEHLYDHGRQIAASEGVRDRRFKYIRYINEDPAYEELYDLEADPDEERNLAGEPAARGLLEEMRARHQGYIEGLA